MVSWLTKWVATAPSLVLELQMKIAYFHCLMCIKNAFFKVTQKKTYTCYNLSKFHTKTEWKSAWKNCLWNKSLGQGTLWNKILHLQCSASGSLDSRVINLREWWKEFPTERSRELKKWNFLLSKINTRIDLV